VIVSQKGYFCIAKMILLEKHPSLQEDDNAGQGNDLRKGRLTAYGQSQVGLSRQGGLFRRKSGQRKVGRDAEIFEGHAESAGDCRERICYNRI
jgi:hypothetical protein